MKRTKNIPIEVIRTSDYVVNKIMELFSERDWLKTCNGTYKLISFYADFLGTKDLYVEAAHFANCTSEETDGQNCYIRGVSGSVCCKNGGHMDGIKIYIYSRKKKLDVLKLTEVVTHEIYHSWDFTFFKNPSRDTERYTLNKNFNPTVTLGQDREKYAIERHIRDLIYFSFDFEQRAYYAGAYNCATLSLNNGQPLNKALKKTTLFNIDKGLPLILRDFNSLYEKNTVNKKYANSILKKNRLSYDRLLNLADKSIKKNHENYLQLKSLLKTQMKTNALPSLCHQ